MSLKSITFLLLTLLISATSFSQEEDNEMGGMESSKKMLEAKHEYNINNMRGALEIYREIIESEPENSAAKYWTAKCHYALKKYDLAEQYAEQSIAIDPDKFKEIDFFRGQIAHRLANLDDAIAFYEVFIKSESKKSLIPEAQDYIKQCKFAKKMMAQPVNVQIVNMGDMINSRFDEYTPSITADGQLILFTSRRSDTKGGEIDESGDHKFYEDVYFSRKDPKTGIWQRASGVEGAVNTDRYDAILSISPKGDHMYLYRNNRYSAGDIFISKYKAITETWSEPEMLSKSINSSYFETSASITSNGKTLYFISERPEGQGQGDIYFVTKNENGEWGKPTNIGDAINTTFDEKFVFIHPNGKTLFFASDGHQGMGSYDIFKTEFVNGQWSFPINLGYPINTVNEESTFSLTKDNQTLLIAAEYSDSYGERDLYQIDVSGYPMLSQGYDKSAYGTFELTVLSKKQKPLNGVSVEFYYADSDVLLKSVKTNRSGIASINLPGNMEYTYKIINKGDSFTMADFVLDLKDGKNPIVKETIQLD